MTLSMLKKTSVGAVLVLAGLVLTLGTSFTALSASAERGEHGYGGGGGVGAGGGMGGGEDECARPWRPDERALQVTIEGGETVRTLNVKLSLKAPGAKKMAVSNSASFTGVSIEDFTNKKDWTLSAGEGVKTVYVRFYNRCNASSPVVTDSVEYKAPKGDVLGEQISLVDELIAKLNVGDNNNDVKKLQTELVRLGYLPRNWRVTTNYGLAVFAAAQRYVDAHPSQDLDGMIARLHFRQVHPDVRRLQVELKRRGFIARTWVITSYYGTVTRNAVRAYQTH